MYVVAGLRQAFGLAVAGRDAGEQQASMMMTSTTSATIATRLRR